MRKVVPVILLLLIGSLGNSIGMEMITDSDESAEYLANQIELSSGLPSSEFERYSRNLAQTLGQLDSSQQAEVFGSGGSAGTGQSNESGGGGSSFSDWLKNFFKKIFGGS